MSDDRVRFGFLLTRVHSFETELLARDENLAGLAALNRELIARAKVMDAPRRVVLDNRVNKIARGVSARRAARSFGPSW